MNTLLKNIKTNIKESTKVAVLALAITLGVTYAFAAWTGPIASPPNSNVDAPINVGTVDQIKSGGLGVDSLAVFGNLGVTGYLQLGTTTSACGSNIMGALRFDSAGKSLEFCDGSTWSALASSTTQVSAGKIICLYGGIEYQVAQEVAIIGGTCSYSSAVDCNATTPSCGGKDGQTLTWTVNGSQPAQLCLGDGTWQSKSWGCSKTCSYTCPILP